VPLEAVDAVARDRYPGATAAAALDEDGGAPATRVEARTQSHVADRAVADGPRGVSVKDPEEIGYRHLSGCRAVRDPIVRAVDRQPFDGHIARSVDDDDGREWVAGDEARGVGDHRRRLQDSATLAAQGQRRGDRELLRVRARADLDHIARPGRGHGAG